jgi:hypothetical protein
MEPKSAVTVAEPTARPVSIPASLTLAVPAGLTDQVAESVIFFRLPSLKSANALSCSLMPFGIERSCGLTAIDTATAGPTVRVAEAATEPEVAVSLVLPTSLLNANPDLLILAIEGCVLVQVTVFVMSCLLSSLNKPVAVSC